MVKPPHTIECRKYFMGERDAFAVLVDGKQVNQNKLPENLEGIVDYTKLVYSFSQGAGSVKLDRREGGTTLYRLDDDCVIDDYRRMVYKFVF